MGQLGDERRALVELSVVRGVSDDEIAGYLGTDAESVRGRREAALSSIAASAGDDSAGGRQRVIDHLRGERAPDTVPEPEPGSTPRRWPVGPAVVGGLLIAFAVALAFSLHSNDESAPKAPGAPAPAPAPVAPTSGGAKLAPLEGGPASGTASLRSNGGTVRLKLSVRGLPSPSSGGYVVWLYDSVTNAHALTGSLKGSFTVDTPLPRDYKRYRYVDISREPADGNRNHSGQSVLRVALSAVKIEGG